jgi:hypothetical protein
MNVVALQVFVSLMLVAGSVVLFVHSVRQRDHEHADRLALAPLEPDDLASLAPPLHQPHAQLTTPEATQEPKETACKPNG